MLEHAAERADHVEVRLPVGVRRALARDPVSRRRRGRRAAVRRAAAGSVTASSATGSSSSPAGNPSRPRDPGSGLERLRGRERRVLEAPSPVLRVRPDHRAGPYPVADELGARPPRARTLVARPGGGPLGRRPVRAVGRTRRPRPTPPSPRSPSAARRATTGSARGWSATRVADDGRLTIELQPARWSLRLVEGDASALGRRAVRGARQRGPLARRAGAPPGSPRGRAAGRSARAARSTSARTRSTRWCASCARSGPSRPSACRPRRSSCSRTSS